MALGCGSKGRSGSDALNLHLSSEAAFLLGKNIHIGSGHLPTWSIRADDPSRDRPVAPPRLAIPAWFWQLRRGIIMPQLGANEMCHRALGRWLLLGALSLLVVRRGSETAAQSRAWITDTASRGSHIQDSREESQTFGETPAVDVGRGVENPFGGDGKKSWLLPQRMASVIHAVPFRDSQADKGCIRNTECCYREIHLREGPPRRPLEVSVYLADVRTEQIAPTDSSTSSACHDLFSNSLGLDGYVDDAAFGLLRLVEAYRGLVITGRRSLVSAAARGTVAYVCAHSRSKNEEPSSTHSKRASGRNFRRAVVQEQFAGMPAIGEDLESLCFHFQEAVQTSFGKFDPGASHIYPQQPPQRGGYFSFSEFWRERGKGVMARPMAEYQDVGSLHPRAYRGFHRDSVWNIDKSKDSEIRKPPQRIGSVGAPSGVEH